MQQSISHELGVDIQAPEYARGFGMQKYLAAEQGLLDAATNSCTHWYIDGSISTEAAPNWEARRIEKLKQQMARHNVSAVFHGNFKIPLAADIDYLRSSAVSYALKEVEVASELSTPLIVHGGAIVETRTVGKVLRQALDNFLDSLSAISERAYNSGVEIWVENLCNYQKNHPFYYIGTTPLDFETIIDRLPQTKFILDVGHANVSGGDPISMFEQFHQSIAALSLSDNDAITDLHAPLGTGNINFSGLVSSIKRLGWKGMIFFETRGSGIHSGLSYLEELEQDLQQT